jgi:CRP-like cAMP-binding protein
MGKEVSQRISKNRILAALSGTEAKSFFEKLQVMHLSDKQVLYEQGDMIRRVYFPTSAVVSLVSVMEDGSSIEQATTGHEGFVGMSVFFGIDKSFAKAIVQVPGEGLGMAADVFRTMVKKMSPLTILLQRYAHALLAQMSRSGGCNSLHSAEERFARWLLAMQDRSRVDELPLTQEFLGEMLGLRRPSVSLVAGKLQKAGLIRYSRGKVTILNRPALEKASCECYRILREEYDHLW